MILAVIVFVAIVAVVIKKGVFDYYKEVIGK